MINPREEVMLIFMAEVLGLMDRKKLQRLRDLLEVIAKEEGPALDRPTKTILKAIKKKLKI